MDVTALEKYSGIPWRYAVILLLSFGVFLTTIFCLVNGIQTVFPHLYYVPIILAAYWYQKSGVLYAAGMGIGYLAFVVLLAGYNPNYVITAVAHVVVFIIIAAIVTVLSMRVSTQQQEIARSEKKFHDIWEQIPAGIILIDAVSHEIIAANPEAERMTGREEKEIIGRSCHEFICPARKGACPVCDLGMTFIRTERVLLTRSGEQVPILKTVTETTIDGRILLIESFIEDSRQKMPSVPTSSSGPEPNP
jgi:PAS domain S-box-containing protein